jgi:hypothetical protein
MDIFIRGRLPVSGPRILKFPMHAAINHLIDCVFKVQWLIDAFERTKACALPKFAHVITRQQWPDFVYSLTVADMNATSGSGSDAEKSFDG